MWQGQSPEERPEKVIGEGVVSDVVRTLGYWRFQYHGMTMMTMEISGPWDDHDDQGHHQVWSGIV